MIRPLEFEPGERRGWLRRCLCRALTARLIVAACLVPAAAAAGDGLFDPYEIETGLGTPQTVLPGFFLGGETAELAVVSLGGDAVRRLRMYGFEAGAWTPVLEATLAPGVQFVDVIAIDGRDRLITYDDGRLSWFDPETATEQPMVRIVAGYRAVGHGIPHVDISRDLNQDGRDDLIVPDLDGFWITTQAPDGSFNGPMKLGPPEPFRDEPVGRLDGGTGDPRRPRTYGDLGITAMTIPVYLGRVHQMDWDQDGRGDLVFWNQDHFEVHRQVEDGRFDPAASSFTVDIPFDSEGVYSRAFQYRDSGVGSIVFGFGKKSQRTVLHSLQDLSGDGVADLVALTLEGRSLTRQRSRYEVHYGTATPDGVRFASQAGATIEPRSKAGGMEPWGYASRSFEDLDGDGLVDLLLRDVAVGTGGMMRTMFGKSVPINLEIYRHRDGAYPAEPTLRRRIRRFAPFSGWSRIFFPPVLVGDVDGDGRSDLLVGKSPRMLHVYLGVEGPGLLSRRPVKIEADLPYAGERCRLVDLNRDGKQDLLMQHALPARRPDQPHRLTVLVAR